MIEELPPVDKPRNEKTSFEIFEKLLRNSKIRIAVVNCVTIRDKGLRRVYAVSRCLRP